MLSCLGGELGQLLREWDAGAAYTEGDTDSLYAAFEKYLANTELLNQHSQNARIMLQGVSCQNRSRPRPLGARHKKAQAPSHALFDSRFQMNHSGSNP